MRSRLVSVKDAVEARLHPRRRADAQTRLRDLRAGFVLFICLGNVCRSPYAERLLRNRAGKRLEVVSAGFIGPGRPPPDAALTVASERGVQHADHRSQLVTPEMLREADAVFFFDRFNRARLARTPGVRTERAFWLGDLDPRWAGKRAIVDPWGKQPEEFHRVFERIERCVDEVWKILEDGLSSPDPGTTEPTP